MSVGLRSALVTGATGFLGSVLVRRLLAEDIEVSCLVRAGSIRKLAGMAKHPRLHVMELEGRDLDEQLRGRSSEVPQPGEC